MISQPAGFEPARGDPNGFQVHRLNHSATTAYVHNLVFIFVYLFLYSIVLNPTYMPPGSKPKNGTLVYLFCPRYVVPWQLDHCFAGFAELTIREVNIV
jgi:hypothetical protein